ncbi:hypothetical protein ACQ4WX_09990 [Streptomyces lasalocidi]
MAEKPGPLRTCTRPPSWSVETSRPTRARGDLVRLAAEAVDDLPGRRRTGGAAARQHDGPHVVVAQDAQLGLVGPGRGDSPMSSCPTR